MGELTVYATVQNRDSSGRYIAGIHERARRAIEETVKAGAEVGKAGASVKTGAMQASITGVVFSDFSGGVTVGTDHWRYQNAGTAPHEITGDVSFFWEREGRPWFAGTNTINHPGNPALHFMDQAADFCRRDFMDAVRRNFG